jgi:uncharacterized protein (DUF302 family)
MTRMTKEIGRRAKKAGAKAQAALAKAERKLGRELRKRRVRRVVREAAEVAAVAGAAALARAVVGGAVRRSGTQPARRSEPASLDVRLPLPHDRVITRVTDALRAEGFGILTRIDAHRTFHEKLGVDFRPYTILGACNPSLAIRALTARPEMGLFLPCNVIVEQLPEGGCQVRIASPIAMLEVSGMKDDLELQAVATEAEKRMARTAEWLREHGHAAVL